MIGMRREATFVQSMAGFVRCVSVVGSRQPRRPASHAQRLDATCETLGVKILLGRLVENYYGDSDEIKQDSRTFEVTIGDARGVGKWEGRRGVR